MSTESAAPLDTPTADPYHPFERVHDTDDPDGVLVILADVGVNADAMELSEGISVADVYPSYPRTDSVYACAYQRTLENTEPHWSMWNPECLEGRLREMDVPVHYYPESKLERYDAGNFTVLVSGRVRCEHCRETVASTGEWATHLVRSCDGL